MTNDFILSVAISDGSSQGYACSKLRASDVDLPFDHFCERYLRPAYVQAAREMALVADKEES